MKRLAAILCAVLLPLLIGADELYYVNGLPQESVKTSEQGAKLESFANSFSNFFDTTLRYIEYPLIDECTLGLIPVPGAIGTNDSYVLYQDTNTFDGFMVIVATTNYMASNGVDLATADWWVSNMADTAVELYATNDPAGSFADKGWVKQ